MPTIGYSNKIGFHCGPGGNRTGIGDHFNRIAQAGRRIVVKSVDDYGLIVEALSADPDAVTIFRMTGGQLELPYRTPPVGPSTRVPPPPPPAPGSLEEAAQIDAHNAATAQTLRATMQPDYALDPLTTAKDHWARIQAALPPEFDKRTWLEVMNEPDKNRTEWLAEFSFHLAHLMLTEDYKLATFSWGPGQPEPNEWSGPKMLNFLTLASANPDNIAIALHEYSLTVGNIRHGYPYHVGRFLVLDSTCLAWKLPPVTILITEFGWTYNQIPGTVLAMEHLKWAAQFYGSHPSILGAAIWYLGGGFGGIADQTQPLIVPLTDLTIALDPPLDPEPPLPEVVHADLFRVTCRALNVRDAPHTGSNVIGKIPRGALIAAIGQHPDPDLRALWRQFGEDVWAAEIYRGVTYMAPHP